jgi:L-amino acid N-acyltransferase YncA
MNLREPKKEDLSAIKDLYARYYDTSEDVDHFVDRVRQSIDQDETAQATDLRYFVAEEEGCIVGIVGFRTLPSAIASFAESSKPGELYSLFVSTKKSGIGTALLQNTLEEMRLSGYTEVVVYSAERWKESWPFYDRRGFVRKGSLKHADGNGGQVWSKKL